MNEKRLNTRNFRIHDSSGRAFPHLNDLNGGPGRVAKSLPLTSFPQGSLLKKEDKYGPFTKRQNGFGYAFERTAQAAA